MFIKNIFISLFLWITATSALAINPTGFSFICDEEKSCAVQIKMSDGSLINYDLDLDNGALSQDLSVVVEGKSISINNVDRPLRYSTKTDTDLWGTAVISNDVLQDGVFLAPDHRIIEIKEGQVAIKMRESQEFADIALPNPDAPELPSLTDGIPLRIEENGKLIPFFPNCYVGNAAMHVLKVGIAIDAGFYANAAGNLSPTSKEGIAKAMAAVDAVVSVGNLVYMQQLHTRIEVDKLTIGTVDSPAPLNYSAAAGTCRSVMAAQSDFGKWHAEDIKNNPERQSGSWVFLSLNCFSGVVGVAWMSSMCGQTNTAVAKADWLIFAHELGHTLGATHSFENGVGTTGGIMDYSDGKYQGVVQFHPNKRQELCPFLDYAKSRSCKYFNIAPTDSCGDGVLSPPEECECIKKGSKSCGACQGCMLTSKNIACSARQFVMRYSDTPDYVTADATNLASLECCNSKGQLAKPKTLCNNKLDVCSAQGKCEQVCTKSLSYNNPNCGFDTTGCLQGCVWNNKCRFDLESDGGLLSKVPNGTACWVTPKKLGVCQSGGCVAPTP